MGNEGIYSVSKNLVKQNIKTFAGPLLVGPSCEIVAKMTTWHDFLSFSHVLHM